MAFVELDRLTKRYGKVTVVNGVDLAIEKGTLVCLLGPSGCGKTTTLRLIAGFAQPSDGQIRVGGQVVSSPSASKPPEARNMSMIFQSYALWPHMTVFENVAYACGFAAWPRARSEPRPTAFSRRPSSTIWRSVIRESCRAVSNSVSRSPGRW